ncbi:biotin--[acetyl-CoA-carboxylase] ligase [Hanstruepera ponticola]|uniref:biotin--[acetyl-CoA-carboxylase] ligase n=1 Tax=Hanstruepera ponticola TaxID=2042995 RepID=UPI000CF188F2|nr:biotin--[acetyl-CoA-carboxylase] ligase [Hanstruepera ponticola]
MHIIKLDAIDSTNSYLRQLSSTKPLKDYTIVMSDYQTKGRGQVGTNWESESGKNLMVSMFKDVSFLELKSHFYISMVVSLAIIKTLQQFSITKLSIKWPNDILSEDKKLCGVLIENVVKQDLLRATIIGIGLNVNQTQFDNLPRASSLKLLSGQHYDINEVLFGLITNIKHYFKILKAKAFDKLKTEYESHLFRKDKPSTFSDTEGNLFSGYIKQVTDSGCLQLLLEDNVLAEFNLKEITLLY